MIILLQKIIKDLIPTFIQILLGYILFPVMCCLLSVLTNDFSSDIVAFFVGLFSNYPILGNFTDAVTTYITSSGNTEQQLEFVTSLLNLSAWDMFALASVGMWSGICFNLGKLIGIRGLPIVQSLLAVTITCVFSNYIASFGDHLYIIMVFIFSLVCNIVLTILISDKKGLALIWGFGCEMVTSVFSMAYVVLLILVMQGALPSFGIWLSLQLCLIIPMSIFLVVDYWFI